MTSARRVLDVAHQVDRQLAPVAAGPEVGEGDDPGAAADHRDREVLQVGGVEAAEREALLARRSWLRQPLVRDRGERRQDRGHGRRRHDLEPAPSRAQAPQRVAQALVARPSIVKPASGTRACSPSFWKVRPSSRNRRQALGHDVVEDGPGAVAVAELAELPEQLEPLLGRPDRLAHGDPAAAAHAEHDEAAAAGAEQEMLVAEQGEVASTGASVGRLDDRAGAGGVVRPLG